MFDPLWTFEGWDKFPAVEFGLRSTFLVRVCVDNFHATLQINQYSPNRKRCIICQETNTSVTTLDGKENFQWVEQFDKDAASGNTL